MSQLRPNCPTDVNRNNMVNNEIFLSVLKLHNDALLLFETRSVSPEKMDEIGQFAPQRMMGIFGAVVSNDRAVEWVEGE